MKKISVILGMITCMLMLAACGAKEKPLDDFETNLVKSCESTVSNIEQIVSSGWEEEAMYADVYNGLISWRDSKKDIGDFNGTNGGTVEKTEEGYVVTVNVQGSSHNATVDFYVDGATMMITDFTTNVIYSTGEKMEKAFMNTLIGMGTVFIVLILISLIISCFGFISKAQDGAKKKEAPAADSVAPAPVAVQPVQPEELSDDTELVAVIAAAIAAYEGSASTDGFVVRSIRKSNKSRWQNA